MKKVNPISVLEESFNFLKDYIDSEITPASGKISGEFIKTLNTESAALLAICKELNTNNEFVQLLNSRLADAGNAKVHFRTEQFFLSDLIDLCEKSESGDSEVSKFVLAYYYDVLRNHHFADETSAASFSQLVSTPEFDETVKRIIQQNRLNTTGRQAVISTLSQLKNPRLADLENFRQKFINQAKLTVPADYFIQAQSEAKKQENTDNPPNPSITLPPADDTLEKTLAELNSLIGMENVKKDVRDLINLLEIQKKRDVGGLKNVDIALHSVFMGPPGTGKTTVARLLGRIFKHLGYLPVGQLYETDREGLIAGYVGQTAIKTDKVIDESVGGVLFIDEAYSLANKFSGNDFGSEAVNTIIKRMEDQRDDLAVVVAGYTTPMQEFINTNPGVRSRFGRYFHFEHFTKEELLQIFEKFCAGYDFALSEPAKEKLQDIFTAMEPLKTESFGNARIVRNLFEKTVQNQANRLIFWTAPAEEYLRIIFPEDLPSQEEAILLLGPPEQTGDEESSDATAQE